MVYLRFHLCMLALVIVFVFLQYRFWFQPGGFFEYRELKKKITIQTVQNEKVKVRNEALAFQIKRLQNSQDATESRARNELGMIKKGEMFYQIVKKE